LSYTNVAKPGAQTYTNLNAAKPSYDETSISFDDSGVYYDGGNSNQWTDITKPSTSWTNIAKP